MFVWLLTGETWTETLAYVLFWGSASFGTFAIILYNGKDFVDAPKLVQKEKMDWICVCGKRLGTEDSSSHTWSLYWPAFHTKKWSFYHYSFVGWRDREGNKIVSYGGGSFQLRPDLTGLSCNGLWNIALVGGVHSEVMQRGNPAFRCLECLRAEVDCLSL